MTANPFVSRARFPQAKGSAMSAAITFPRKTEAMASRDWSRRRRTTVSAKKTPETTARRFPARWPPSSFPTKKSDIPPRATAIATASALRNRSFRSQGPSART